MNQRISPIKVKFFSPSRVQKAVIKKSSIICDETISSSSELENVTHSQSNVSLHQLFKERIRKAHTLCETIKLKHNQPKPSHKNQVTLHSFFEDMREKPKVVESQMWRKNNFEKKFSSQIAKSQPMQISSEKLLNHFSIPTVQSILSKDIPLEVSRYKPDSPDRAKSSHLKGSRTKDSNFSKRKILQGVQNGTNQLREAKNIESFFLDEDQQLEISVVEEHGDDVLDWGVCKGKASEFKILKFLDEGRFGKVYLAQSYQNNMIYSVKTLYRDNLDSQALQQLIREVKIQSFLNHPGIVKLYNFFVDDDQAYLVLQPCLGKNLFQNLKENGRMQQKMVKEYIKQICIAVEYMHNNDIIHRDLKPENILLHENTIKICDFGWAIHSPLLRNTQCGTPVYTSPQIVNKEPYDSKIDIWSIGVLTYELLYGNIPFQIRRIEDLAKITQQEVYFSSEIVVSEAAKDFMMNCLSKNPMKRYSIRQLLEHEFLFKMDKYRLSLAT